MNFRTQFNSVTPFSKILSMVLFISLPFITFFLGIVYQQKTSISSNSNISTSTNYLQVSSTPQVRQNKCDSNGWSTKDIFLPIYIVKSGDTILSVAKTQLGDVSRVNELIELNKDNYPSISISQPFIEVGWRLFLPPTFVKKSSGKLEQMNGELEDVNGERAWMIYSSVTGETGPWEPQVNTLIPKVALKKGDCVSMMYDSKTGVIFSYSLQE